MESTTAQSALNRSVISMVENSSIGTGAHIKRIECVSISNVKISNLDIAMLDVMDAKI